MLSAQFRFVNFGQNHKWICGGWRGIIIMRRVTPQNGAQWLLETDVKTYTEKIKAAHAKPHEARGGEYAVQEVQNGNAG